jgi:hypothetical protein
VKPPSARWPNEDADAPRMPLSFAQNAPSDRLKILSLRGFVRQLEQSFTIPLKTQLARWKGAGLGVAR